MRKTIVLGTILVLVQIPLLAYVLLQERTWGGPDRDGARGVAVRALDGSVYVTGATRSFDPAGEDAFLLKYDAGGNLLWQRTYGEATDATTVRAESGVGVVVAPDDSGVLVAGNYNGGRIFLAKFAHDDGALIWARTWGGDQETAGGIALASDGTIYVTGITNSFGAGQSDAFLLSFTPDGTLNWQRTWGGGGFDPARDIAVATDGGIYISGETNSFGARAAFLVKFADTGAVISEVQWGLLANDGVTTGDTLGNGVAAAPGGGAYVAGRTFEAGFNPNLVVVHIDGISNVVWARVGGPGFGAAQDVAVGPEGNVHVTGSILSEDELTGGNAFVWTLLGNGKPDSAAIWGGNEEFEGEAGEGIAVTPTGDIVVVGSAGAPPYVFDRGSKNAKRANTFLAAVAGVVTTPALALVDPGIMPGTPEGSETFAGVSDAFLIRVQQ